MLRLRELWESFKAKFRGPKRYYLVILHSRYTNVGQTLDTAVVGYIFSSKADAVNHCEYVEQNVQAFAVTGILPIRTSLPVTVAHYDYSKTDAHPNVTVSFEWPEGVDRSLQDQAEGAVSELQG